MKRGILFRGKSEESGEWVYGSLDLSGRTGFPCSIIAHDKFLPWTSKAVKPETVGQFTGRTDLNGKKIFEGDIVKTIRLIAIKTISEIEDIEIPIVTGYEKKEYLNLIDWFDGIRVSGWRIKGKGFQTALKWSTVANMQLEVVGNIHDNPELLK